VGGADRVSAGDGGQPLDVGAQQPLERPCFCLAQLRELGRDVRDRAVVLAELAAGADLVGRRSVALAGQRLGQRLDLLLGGADLGAVPLLDGGDPEGGELGDGLVAAGLGQEPQRGRGQVVVRVREAAPALRGEQELPRRPATPALGAASGAARGRSPARRRPARRGAAGPRSG
jgi:hypothetical protein